MANPYVKQEPANPADIMELTVSSSLSIVKASLISWESDTATVMDAAADDDTFAGFALNQTDSSYTEPDRLVTALVGVINLDCASDTYEPFVELMYSDTNAVEDASANTIGWVWRKVPTAATRLDMYVNVPALGKLFTATA